MVKVMFSTIGVYKKPVQLPNFEDSYLGFFNVIVTMKHGLITITGTILPSMHTLPNPKYYNSIIIHAMCKYGCM